MTYEEAIKIIELAIVEVECNYPVDYSAAFDKAIEALRIVDKLDDKSITNCKKEGFVIADLLRNKTTSNCKHSVETDDRCFWCRFYYGPATEDKCNKCNNWTEK